jgi:hypothetical protein
MQKFGVEQMPSGFYVIALDDGGRPKETRWMFRSKDSAEYEALSMNKVKHLRDGTIDDKCESLGGVTWREFYETRMGFLKETLQREHAQYLKELIAC